MVHDAEHLVGVAIEQVGVLGLGKDGGHLERGLVVQLDLPVALASCQDVDVRVEAETQHFTSVTNSRLYLTCVVIPGPTRHFCNFS